MSPGREAPAVRKGDIVVADQGGYLICSTSHGIMTAWMGPETPCVAVEGYADECEEAGAGGKAALGAGACGDNISGSESVSMSSHFE